MYLIVFMLATLYCCACRPYMPVSECCGFPDRLPSEISMIPDVSEILSAPFCIAYWHWQNRIIVRSAYKGRYFVLLCLLLSGQVELNPGPQNRTVVTGGFTRSVWPCQRRSLTHSQTCPGNAAHAVYPTPQSLIPALIQ